jgi:hypothetical protein
MYAAIAVCAALLMENAAFVEKERGFCVKEYHKMIYLTKKKRWMIFRKLMKRRIRMKMLSPRSILMKLKITPTTNSSRLLLASPNNPILNKMLSKWLPEIS